MKILFFSLVVLSFSACAVKSTHETSQSPVTPNANVPAEAGKPNEETKMSGGASPQQLANKETEGLQITTKPLGKPTVTANGAPAKPAAPAPTPVPTIRQIPRGPVSSEKALGWLKNGNTRFVKHYLRKDGDLAKDRTRLVPGQKPHSIVISCSDSRVPPEVIFDQKLGEIYVIRTAGESMDSSAIASVEYALEHLGSNLILVLGHDSCGTLKAAIDSFNGSDAGSPWLNKLVQDLQPHLRSFKGKPLSEGLVVEGWANVSGVAKDLAARSQIVRDAVNSGEVKIQTALYHLGSGVVEFK